MKDIKDYLVDAKIYDEAKELSPGRFMKLVKTSSSDSKNHPLNNGVFIVFDTETTGLIDYNKKKKAMGGLQIELPRPIKDELKSFYKPQLKQRFPNLSDEDFEKQLGLHIWERFTRNMEMRCELAEIAAVAFDGNGNELDSMHHYVQFDKTMILPKVERLISWSKEKDEKATAPKKALDEFADFISKYIDQYGVNNTFLIAHNAAFDMSVLSRLSHPDILNSKLYNILKSKRGIRVIDTKKTKKLRKSLPELKWPKVKDKEGKETKRDSNTQASLINMLEIRNTAAHTAEADVKALGQYFFSILKKLKVGDMK